MKPHAAFHNPVKIVEGPGSLPRLAELLNGRRFLVLSSPGWANRLGSSYFNELPGFAGFYGKIEANPDFDSVQRHASEIERYNFELLVGLGGGSVLDSCKFLAVSHASGCETATKLTREGAAAAPYKIAPMIAIPTTAGSGSEVTPWGTVWDSKNRRKYSLTLPDLWFEACICDAQLTLDLPWQITLTTGLDALSHALESIWNVKATSRSVALAEGAAAKVFTALPKVHADPRGIEGRTELMHGALQAGLAFSETQTSLAHAISYWLTLNCGIVHGLAASFSLPVLIDCIIGRSETIDRSIRNIFGEVSSRPLRRLYEELQVPVSLADLEIRSEQVETLKQDAAKYPQAKTSLFDFDLVFQRL